MDGVREEMARRKGSVEQYVCSHEQYYCDLGLDGDIQGFIWKSRVDSRAKKRRVGLG